MVREYTASRNVPAGNEEEYIALKQLAEKYGAIKIEDEVDLDSFEYSAGVYGKYYLCFTFPDLLSRTRFTMEAKAIIKPGI